MATGGLVQQAQQPQEQAPQEQAQAQAQAPQEQPQPEGEGDSNLTPEEQESYDSAMQMVGEMLYSDDASSQAILDLITAENPAPTIAEATIFLLSKIEETFQGNYPEDLIIVTVDEISDLLLELVDTSGKVAITEDIAKDVKAQLVEQLAEEYGADPEDMQVALGDVTQADADEMQGMYGGQQ